MTAQPALPACWDPAVVCRWDGTHDCPCLDPPDPDRGRFAPDGRPMHTCIVLLKHIL